MEIDLWWKMTFDEMTFEEDNFWERKIIRQLLMKDNLGWMKTFNWRWLLIQHNFWWYITFDWRWPLIEDDLWWKMTFDGRGPLMEDNFWWKTSFGSKVKFAKLKVKWDLIKFDTEDPSLVKNTKSWMEILKEPYRRVRVCTCSAWFFSPIPHHLLFIFITPSLAKLSNACIYKIKYFTNRFCGKPSFWILREIVGIWNIFWLTLMNVPWAVFNERYWILNTIHTQRTMCLW